MKEYRGIGLEETEELTFDKLLPRYRSGVINRYQSFLALIRAMKKEPLHKKITATSKRLGDDDEFEEDETLRYAIKSKYLLERKIDEFDQRTYSLDKHDESGSLQHVRSRYAHSNYNMAFYQCLKQSDCYALCTIT